MHDNDTPSSPAVIPYVFMQEILRLFPDDQTAAMLERIEGLYANLLRGREGTEISLVRNLSERERLIVQVISGRLSALTHYPVSFRVELAMAIALILRDELDAPFWGEDKDGGGIKV
jgi:hypothetical protein